MRLSACGCAAEISHRGLPGPSQELGSPAEVGASHLDRGPISLWSFFLRGDASFWRGDGEDQTSHSLPASSPTRAGTPLPPLQKPTICLPPRLLSASERLLNYIVQWEKKANGLDSRSNPPCCRRLLSAALGLNRTYISTCGDVFHLFCYSPSRRRPSKKRRLLTFRRISRKPEDCNPPPRRTRLSSCIPCVCNHEC